MTDTKSWMPVTAVEAFKPTLPGDPDLSVTCSANPIGEHACTAEPGRIHGDVFHYSWPGTSHGRLKGYIVVYWDTCRFCGKPISQTLRQVDGVGVVHRTPWCATTGRH